MSSLKVISFGIYEDNQNPINHIYKNEEVLYIDGCFWDTNTWVFGYLNGYKGKTENELISYYELICKKRLDLKYRIISAPEYMKNIIPIMDKHNELYKKASKYKRMRHGNPDVDLYFDHYNRYKYEIENAHFDIAVSNILFEYEWNDHITRVMFLEKRKDASDEERKYYMERSMLSFYHQEITYFKDDLSEAKNQYESFMKNANKLIKNRKSLLFVATRIVSRYQTIKEMTIDEFSFDEYIHGYNDIYRINNSNYNKG